MARPSYHFYLSETAAPNLHPLPLPDNVTILHVGTLGMVLQPMASTLEAVVGGIGTVCWCCSIPTADRASPPTESATWPGWSGCCAAPMS